MKENSIKFILSGIFAAISAYFGILAIPIVVLLCVMICDYATGLTAAFVKGSLSSAKGWRGIIKKACYMIAVVVGIVVDYVVSSACSQLHIDIGTVFYFGLLVTIWLILNELLSIIENLSEIGVPMPEWLRKAVEKLTDKVDLKGKDFDKKDGNEK